MGVMIGLYSVYICLGYRNLTRRFVLLIIWRNHLNKKKTSKTTKVR